MERCLAAVAAQTRQPDRILLLDNHSADGTADVAARAAARWRLPVEISRLETNVGFARANNLLVAAADDCEWVALLNPDAFPEPEWLARLEAAAVRHPDAGSLASRLMRDGSPGTLDGAGDVYHVSGLVWRHGYGRRCDEVAGALIERPVFAACAAAALYRRSAWLNAGGLDESYFCYVEDVDLGFRLQLCGQRCWYIPDAVASHVGSATSGAGSAFAVYHGHRNLMWTFAKDMPGRLAWRYLLAHIAATLVAIVWFTFKGRGGAIVRAKWDGLKGLRATLAARDAVQHRRTVPVKVVAAQLDRSSLLQRWIRLVQSPR